MTRPERTIAVVGGTGDLGLGLASRLASSYKVVIGSRDEKRAIEAARKASRLSNRELTGMTNDGAVAAADVAILAIPDLPSDPRTLLSLKPNLRGKLVISPIVPMEFRDGDFLPTEPSLKSPLSAAEAVRSLLGTSVTAAFHHVPAARLLEVGKALDYDVLIAAETRREFEQTSELVANIPHLRPLYAGSLRNARALELLTPTLLNAGKLNGIKTPSIRVV